MIDFNLKVDAMNRISAGEKLSDISAELHVSRATLYSWQKNFNAFGTSGLLPKSRRPLSSPRILAESDVNKIIDTALNNPTLDTRSLLKVIKKQGLTCSLSTVSKYLKKGLLSTPIMRKEYLLNLQDSENESTLTHDMIKGLELLSPHFAERQFIEKSSGIRFLVLIKNWRVGKKILPSLPTWYFVDLHSFHVTAIINDSDFFDSETKEYQQAFSQDSQTLGTWPEDILTPISVWWDVYGKNYGTNPIELLFKKRTFDPVTLNALSQNQNLTDIGLKIIDEPYHLPEAFIRDFELAVGPPYASMMRTLGDSLSVNAKFEKSESELTSNLLVYNWSPLQGLYPNSKVEPEDRVKLPDILLDNPIVTISRYLTSREKGKDLFISLKGLGLPFVRGEEFGARVERKRKGEYLGSIPESILKEERDKLKRIVAIEEEGDPPKFIRVDRPPKNGFQLAHQEINIKDYTNIKDPNSPIRRLSAAIPFTLVYGMLMGGKPKGRTWVCPRCKQKAMRYYKVPAPGHKESNLGYCFSDKGGCNTSTNSINLLNIKKKYLPPQAFKWMLANFDPNEYEVDIEFELLKQDRKMYRSRLRIQ